MLITDKIIISDNLNRLLLSDPFRYTIKIHRMYKPSPVAIQWEIEEGRQNNDMHLMMVLGGDGHYTIGANHYNMKKGHLYLVSNGCPHSAYTDSKNPVRIYSMRFGIYDNASGHWLADFFPNPFGIRLQELPAQCLVLLDDCYHHFLDPKVTSATQIDVKMKHLLLTLADLMGTTEAATISNDYTDMILTRHGIGITLAELAAKANLSEKQFTRNFTHATGATPHQYILRIRMNHAKHLLEDTDLTIQIIAAKLGYADAFTFSRQFKKSVGKSPTDFRNQFKIS